MKLDTRRRARLGGRKDQTRVKLVRYKGKDKRKKEIVKKMG